MDKIYLHINSTVYIYKNCFNNFKTYYIQGNSEVMWNTRLCQSSATTRMKKNKKSRHRPYSQGAFSTM